MDSYIVAYDISDPKRLRKVATCCKDFGVRKRYSVFLCRLSAMDFVRLRSRLYDLIQRHGSSRRSDLRPSPGKCLRPPSAGWPRLWSGLLTGSLGPTAGLTKRHAVVPWCERPAGREKLSLSRPGSLRRRRSEMRRSVVRFSYRRPVEVSDPVGWVEWSETHRVADEAWWVSLHSTHPTRIRFGQHHRVHVYERTSVARSLPAENLLATCRNPRRSRDYQITPKRGYNSNLPAGHRGTA
jgi:CRISPR associated protein Cas2